jgi:hypothetical protein
VNVLETAVASVLALVGLRSLVVWSRRPFESTSVRDQLLYALFRTGRIGVWFALAGIFFAYAIRKNDESLRWLVLVPIALAAVSAWCGYALGRAPGRPS